MAITTIKYRVEIEIEATAGNDLSYVSKHGINEDEILGEISDALCCLDVFEGAIVSTTWAEDSGDLAFEHDLLID